MASKLVAIITMSTRGTRVGPKVAEFVRKAIEKPLADSGIDVNPVDLVKFNLPVYNEAVAPASVPARGSFQFAHTKAWSAEIARYDGYVLVIPEYNASVAGGTKNAIDYLYNEWKGKPVVIVSYGVQGGRAANDQVKGALAVPGLLVVEPRPTLAFAGQADTFAAVGEGKLGDATRADWESNHLDTVLEAAAGLKRLLLNPKPEEEKAQAQAEATRA
ncbi:NADPH-dependent FMN reductase family protein [Durotheca rogersii]|uniref:NADPH-dependent FMN reductase family protein n=1 Tax=Durotheca rogersii TaxID=419775 RepID=UPI00222032F2|nr:NADPH-dependent FMN reductase family protein [Durotheca rogersii]KAI5862876.1 NADPH-dependent FMN reductase family protein [Durotheca rogersii]